MAVQAYRWWCEDEICDCTQYVIERTTPHPVTRGFVNRERLWEGEFFTDSCNLTRTERATALREFRTAAHRFGVPLHRRQPLGSWFGEQAHAVAPR